MNEKLGSPVDKNSPFPAHTQLRQRLLSLILDGTLVPGEKLISEPEIATHFKVSRMTANKSILALVADGWLVRSKGRGTFVTEQTKSKEFKRQVKQVSRRISIAIEMDIWEAVNDFYFGALYWGIQSALHAKGYNAELVQIDKDFIDGIRESAGTIIAAPKTGLKKIITSALETGKPMVILGAQWQNFPLPQVDSDNHHGAALAVNHLADLGHERIMFIGTDRTNTNTIDRAEGFKMALEARKLPVNEDLIWLTEDYIGLRPDEKIKLNEIMHGENAPTAIFAAGSKIAISVMTVGHHMALKMPEQLSVVGYDDPDFLSLAYPAVTTIRQPIAAMAEQAVEILIKKIQGDKIGPEIQMFEPTLVVRKSTCPPKNVVRA